jgi:small subunit ribosomal protein S20
MAEEKESSKKKVKRPTAKKRDIQAEKRRVKNKAFRSQVLSVVRSLESAIKSNEAEAMKLKLAEVYSLMDKGVKTGIYKINKASRVKERFTRDVKAKA